MRIEKKSNNLARITCDAEHILHRKGGEDYPAIRDIHVSQNDADNFEELPANFPEVLEARKAKLEELAAYDTSPAVNSFILQGDTVWIDNLKRISVTDSATKEKAMGRTSTTFWLDGRRYDLPIDIALQMLTALEVYAKDCYNTTAAHAAAIAELDTVEAITAYDFTVGYPAKLNLSTIVAL